MDGTIVRIAPVAVFAAENTREGAGPHRGGERRGPHHADASAQLLARRGNRCAAEADEHSLEPRPGVGRPPHEHVDHHRSPGSADRRVGSDYHDRRAAAAGGDRSAHRADDQELRAGARHPVGVQRHRLAAARQHHEPGVSQQRNARRPIGPAGAGRWGHELDRGEPPCGRRGQQRHRAATGIDQRGVRPRRGADGARRIGQRPPAVVAESVHAEQRGGRSGAGRPDPDSDCRPTTR